MRADFGFDTSVTAAVDCLRARFHPRSLVAAAARGRVHRFRAVGRGCRPRARRGRRRVARADAARARPPLPRGGDAPQGFVLAADLGGGFGGLARELLAQIRDDYSTAVVGSLSARTPARCRRRPHHRARANWRRRRRGGHRYRHALHDAPPSSFDAELDARPTRTMAWRAALGRRHAAAGTAAAAAAQTSAAAAAAAGGGSLPYVVAPPYVTPRAGQLPRRRAFAALLDGATPARAAAPASPASSSARCASASMHLAAGSLALPPPPPPHAAGGGTAAGAVHAVRPPSSAGVGAHVRPARGVARAPRRRLRPADAARAGGGGGGAAAAAAAARPRGSWRAAVAARRDERLVWSRPQPLQLPLPQFFAPSLAADGAPLAPPDGPPPDTPRADDDEVMLPVGAALRCTPGLVPLLRRCRDAYSPAPRGRRAQSALRRPRGRRARRARRGGAGDDRGVRGGAGG